MARHEALHTNNRTEAHSGKTALAILVAIGGLVAWIYHLSTMNTGERDGTTYHAKEWQELMDRNQFDSFIDKEIKAGRQKTGHRPLPPAQPLAKTRNA